MCGRATLVSDYKQVESLLSRQLDAEEIEEYNRHLPNYNVAPTHLLPVVTSNNSGALSFKRWGLIPFWAKDSKIGSKLINARAETVGIKASFRNAFKKRRCLVLIDGYYEWRKSDGKKLPFRVTFEEGQPFAVAGLWEEWKNPEGKSIDTFTMITRSANVKMSGLHHRMPYAVLKDYHQLWLTGDFNPENWADFMEDTSIPFSDYYPVSADVNHVKNNHPQLIEPQ